MSTELNKKIIERLYNEGIAERKFKVFDELIAEKFVNHGIPNTPTGPAGFKSIVQQFLSAFPDMKISNQQIIAEDDTVATRGSWTGTHEGDFMGIHSTGRRVRIDYIDFWKISNGKCIENWLQMDMISIMQQIGSMETAL